MAKKRTPEELVANNERTTSIGLFLNAEAYWSGANVLYRSNKRKKRTVPFGEKPLYYCYYHAIELYLKAFLRCQHGVDELEGNFRHRTIKMMKRAQELGISFDDEDVEVLIMMGDTDAVIRSRYPRTGSFSWPTLEALNRTCKSLRVLVHKGLQKSGVSVRPIYSSVRPTRRPKARPRHSSDVPDGFEAG